MESPTPKASSAIATLNSPSQISLREPRKKAEWVAKRLGRTVQLYPSFAPSEDGLKAFVEAWAALLDEFGPEKFEAALTTHINRSKFFPTVAELRELIAGKQEDADAAEALKQWAWIKRFVNRNYYEDLGGLRHKEQIPERTWETIRICGGARRIYFMRDQDEPFEQRRFLEAYRLVEKTAEPMAQKQLESGE